MRYQNADQQVIGFIVENLSARSTTWLCTVLSTWGSSPRPRGSLFTFNERGETAGSLSGGCVEEDLVERTLKRFSEQGAAELHQRCDVIVFGATPEEAGRLQLPCGGQLRVSVECLDCSEPGMQPAHLLATTQMFEQIAQSLEAQVSLIREVMFIPYQTHLVAAGEVGVQTTKTLTERSVVEEEDRFLHFLGPTYTLLLIGISEVSKAVAMMATILDYEIVVCDPRVERLETWTVDGVTVIHGMPDEVIAAQPKLNYTAILALTHDPRIDDMGLMEALTREAFYIGAMGSERSSAKRRERMLALDITEQQLQVLHAPIGLDIGSKTPAEIALSILADITLHRRMRNEIKAPGANDTRS